MAKRQGSDPTIESALPRLPSMEPVMGLEAKEEITPSKTKETLGRLATALGVLKQTGEEPESTSHQ